MTRKKFEIRKQSLLPGFEEGRFEPRRFYEQGEFQSSFDDGLRRDNRLNIKVSGKDLTALKRTALEQGLPVQTLLAQIIHQYANGELRPAPSEEGLPQEPEEAAESLFFPFQGE